MNHNQLRNIHYKYKIQNFFNNIEIHKSFINDIDI
jgi:hypothetical protein